MKRVNNIFGQIVDINNLNAAHANAKKGKAKYKEVKLIDSNLDYYINKLQQMLINKTYVNSDYEIFQRKCSNKTRVIYKLPYFPDRVIHHAILQIAEPIWRSVFIRDTYQSIKGRGVHDAVNRIDKHIRKYKPEYCLKIDIHKFYPSVNNEILKQIVRKKIKCKDTLWLLDTIIDSVEGLPIGNYISQYFGNLYLAYFDHYIKDKFNLKFYYRYCDDIVILHNDKDYLRNVLHEASRYLKNELKLQVKSNYQIFPVQSRGIDFLGYRFFHTHTLLRNSIKRHFIRKSRRYHNTKSPASRKSLSSLYGWIKHCNGHNLLTKYLNDYESVIKSN